MPQSQTAALPRHQKEAETDTNKQAQNHSRCNALELSVKILLGGRGWGGTGGVQWGMLGEDLNRFHVAIIFALSSALVYIFVQNA